MNYHGVRHLEMYLRDLPALVLALDASDLNGPSTESEWSKKEILGHLADVALYCLERFAQVKTSNTLLEVEYYPPEALVRVKNYQSQSTEDIINLWTSVNQQIIWLWKSYSRDELSMTVRNTESDREGDLLWWMICYIDYLGSRLEEILGSPYFEEIKWYISEEWAKRKLVESDTLFAELMKHGTMSVEYYVPDKVDKQTPHEQDELYVIAAGTGVFYNDGLRYRFEKGDILFVSAGKEHRFEHFSDDFATWVIFYGPKGGEKEEDPDLDLD